MPRIVVLGCGTGVGKTRVSVALLRALTRAGSTCIGLKPIESGFVRDAAGGPPLGSDAEALSDASTYPIAKEHPLHALAPPISPHLAARLSGAEIRVSRVAEWVRGAEDSAAPLVSSYMAIWAVIETAGGVFTPLSANATNFDLAMALEPAVWVLVASDSLGVLHDLSATLQAMATRGRSPDHVVLSAARPPDASTGSNAHELSALGIVAPSAVLTRDGDDGIVSLTARLFESENRDRPATRL